MRLKDFWATAVRRWYLVLLALVLSAVATILIIVRVGPTYTAEGTALVFPPTSTVQRDGAVETVGNPYLNLQGVTLARDIVIRALSANSTREELAESAPGSTFEVTPDYLNSAPIIIVSVEADSPEAAGSLLTDVMNRIPSILSDLQSGLNLADDALITSKALIPDSRPEPDYKSQIRAGIAALVATLGISLLAIGLIDGLLSARREDVGRRRRQVEQVKGSVDVMQTPPSSSAPYPGSGGDSEPPPGSRRLGMRPAQAPGSSDGRKRTADDRISRTPDTTSDGRRAGHSRSSTSVNGAG